MCLFESWKGKDSSPIEMLDLSGDSTGVLREIALDIGSQNLEVPAVLSAPRVLLVSIDNDNNNDSHRCIGADTDSSFTKCLACVNAFELPKISGKGVLL